MEATPSDTSPEGVPFFVHHHLCYDCRRDCGSYMVHDEVWDRAWPGYHQLRRELRAKYPVSKYGFWGLVLCFKCLERRLGRPLVLGDFTKAVINQPIVFGFGLGRLTGGFPAAL